MPPPCLSRALLCLTLVHTIAGADVRNAAPRSLQAVSANATASGVATCPSGDSPLARATAPALTPLCPSSCVVGGVCIYYPQGFQSDCVTTNERTCVAGDTCAFECFPSTGATTPGWLLTLYNSPSVVEQAVIVNSDECQQDTQYRSVTINASRVTQWIGSFEFAPIDAGLFITGNEPANNMVLDDEETIYEDALPLPPGDVVPFELPPTFFEDVQGFGWLRLENIKFPALENVTPALAFPALGKVFLRNTLLTTFPLANASFPALSTLDLSANRIPEIVPSMIPDSVTFLNLSWNAISRVAKNALPTNLTALDVRYNSIKEIANGTLPLGIQKLWLSENLLEEIPADVSGMNGLNELYLNDNNLREIPDAAIPTSLLERVNFDNCSLTAVPKALRSMTQLKRLWLGRNDLSHDPDFSVLPESLEWLSLADCQLQKLPTELKKLRSLQILDLENNPKAVADGLSSIPKRFQYLFLEKNALETFPADLKRLSIEGLFMQNNPLGKIAPGLLPDSLSLLMLSDTTFRVLPNGSLPSKLDELTIMNCALEEVPGDLLRVRHMSGVEISDCQLQAFDLGDFQRDIQFIDVHNNRITSFAGSYPTLYKLYLRNNALTAFNGVNSSVLNWLDLSGNNISTFPDTIFQMPELVMLNLTGNPIRNFRPTTEQLTFLRRVQTVVLDQAMFASDCVPSTRVKFGEYDVCPQQETTKTAPASKSWKWLVPLNVVLALVLVLLVYTFWRRRKLQKQRLDDLAIEQANLAKQQQDQANISIWADGALLRDRVDEDLVTRVRLLGAGMFGEVWLATYKNEKVALKQLKQAGSHGGVVDSEAINDFVHEIKLLQSLTHPSVVQFVGVMWSKESDIAMITEYMDGGDLRSYLDQHPKIYGGWTTQKVRIALQVTEAIVYLHSLDPLVIHRDLKSRNVLLDKGMRAKLSDFGVSRYKLDDDTMTAAVGTVRWVAPEVLAGQRYNEAVDIYSLGVIFSEIDTHKLPFEGLSDESGGELLSDSAIAAMVVTGALRVGVSKTCPSEIRSLVDRCTAFEGTARPRAMDVAFELRTMLEGSSSSTATTTSTRSSKNGIFGSPTSPIGTDSTQTVVEI